MIIGITIIQVLVAIALVLIVLLQTGRGSEIGAAFGSGASQTLFGSSGTSGFMTRLTTIVVVVFMLSSLFLAYMYSRAGEASYVRTRRPVPTSQSSAPVQQAPMQPGSAQQKAPVQSGPAGVK
jgi:preprotein translocase subunit SecG